MQDPRWPALSWTPCWRRTPPCWSRRPHTLPLSYLKPPIPVTSAVPELLQPPELGGAVGNRRFYSWRNPLSQNWDSEAGLLPGSGYQPGTPP